MTSPDRTSYIIREGEGMKRGIFFAFLLLGVLQNAPLRVEAEAVFSPGESIKGGILKEIESTTSTLDLAIHEISSSDLASALIKARQQGVKVRVITDAKQSKIKSSRITSLIHQGIPVKVLGGKERGAMNHRFAIFDGKKVLTGSFNWSEASAKWNYENILIFEDTEAVTSYQNEFDRLWREKRVIK